MWSIRVWRVAGVGVFCVALGASQFGSLAWAVPSPAPIAAATATPTAPASAKPGKNICTITDIRLTALSGMLAVGRVIYVNNETTGWAATNRIYKLDQKCRLIGLPIAYPALSRDPEDMALGLHGEIWIADTGDDGANPIRPTIALWKLAKDKITGPYRMSYPSDKYDAEALLIGSDGVPIVITKDWSSDPKGKTHLFSPVRPVRVGMTVPMKQVGEVALPRTLTPTPLGPLGRRMVTGAAQAPDHSRVVLRTYGDALEWDVTGGNIVAALTTSAPRVTPLPDEPWGEAITYSADGKKLLSVSETRQLPNGDPNKSPVLLSYTPAAKPFIAPPLAEGLNEADAPAGAWPLSLFTSLGRVYGALGGGGVFGLLLVMLGMLRIVRNRRAVAATASGTAEPVDNKRISMPLRRSRRGGQMLIGVPVADRRHDSDSDEAEHRHA